MRKILKTELEGKEHYVIWCNTVDMLMPNLFESMEAVNYWLENVYSSKIEGLFNEFKKYQGTLSVEKIKEVIKEFSHD